MAIKGMYPAHPQNRMENEINSTSPIGRVVGLSLAVSSTAATAVAATNAPREFLKENFID